VTDPIHARNPRTGEVDYEVEPPDESEVNELESRARSAGREWRERDLDQRLDALDQWWSEIEARRGTLLDALVADTGRRDVSQLEIDTVGSIIERVREQAPSVLAAEGKGQSSVPFVRLDAQHVPYELATVIGPWNFPLLLTAIDAIPALAAGCAVITKPSEVTPRFIEPIQETIRAVPALRDVVTFVPGGESTGGVLVDRGDAVAFTGSVETGRAIADRTATSLTPAFLELGGKDPAVVLESADLDLATSAILWGATANSGQSCQSIERVYVHENCHDEFVERLTAKARNVDLAYPDFDDGELGPIIDTDQVTTIRMQLDDAVSNGATVKCGGEIETHGGGRWVRPTVLTGVDHSMAVATEETFGPVIPVMSFATIDAAVEQANDTTYGLSAATLAGTQEEALAVARQIDAGAVSVNDASLTAIIQEGEKQSFKRSGLGQSRTGPRAIGRFLRKKSLLVKTNAAPDPWWHDLDGNEGAE
jgi:acyl-CoA reductase-like NAD-dependent aldehyde dehydrogenase